MVVIAGAMIALVLGDPGQHTIKLTLDQDQMKVSAAQTTTWAEHLLDSPTARLLDPHGHDKLVRAVEIQHRLQAGGHLEVSELGLGADIFTVTNDHQVAVHNLKWSLLLYLGMVLAGTVVGFLLWRRDSRSGAWILASCLIVLAPMITAFIAVPGFPMPGLAVVALWLAALATVGRESMRALRLRT